MSGSGQRQITQDSRISSMPWIYYTDMETRIIHSGIPVSDLCRVCDIISNSTMVVSDELHIIFWSCLTGKSNGVASALTHWGRVTHICVGNLTIIGSDIGLSPGRRQVIIWTNAGILLIGTLGTNFNEIVIGIQTFSFEKMHLKISSAKGRPFCLGLNELIQGV